MMPHRAHSIIASGAGLVALSVAICVTAPFATSYSLVPGQNYYYYVSLIQIDEHGTLVALPYEVTQLGDIRRPVLDVEILMRRISLSIGPFEFGEGVHARIKVDSWGWSSADREAEVQRAFAAFLENTEPWAGRNDFLQTDRVAVSGAHIPPDTRWPEIGAAAVVAVWAGIWTILLLRSPGERSQPASP